MDYSVHVFGFSLMIFFSLVTVKENSFLPMHFFFFTVHVQMKWNPEEKAQFAVGALTLVPEKQCSLYSAGLAEKSFELMSSIQL